MLAKIANYGSKVSANLNSKKIERCQNFKFHAYIKKREIPKEITGDASHNKITTHWKLQKEKGERWGNWEGWWWLFLIIVNDLNRSHSIRIGRLDYSRVGYPCGSKFNCRGSPVQKRGWRRKKDFLWFVREWLGYL